MPRVSLEATDILQDPPNAEKQDAKNLPSSPAPKTSDASPSTIQKDADSNPNANPNDLSGKQSKRILGIIPNYRAVSVDTHLPPQSVKEKFWLATQDTFDYSNFIFVGGLAGISMAGRGEPAFGNGAAGYGRYYWHTFADVGVGNYMTEAIVPTLTREDPRYYTLGRGGVFKRTGYAISRLFVTRTDAGNSTFNLSEIVGNGAAAGISNTYYPKDVNVWVKTYQHWGEQIAFDGIGNILKEFWPDINKAVFHMKY